ncbi:MAG: alpha-glucosidase/alpha-galactosidase [Thermomicrobia bacterium]|nr:alpha-glucosidase/alpha-galactosidase [Thermomicrobia bacterium]
MAKITMIGAGSVVFAKNLLGDILSHPELRGSEIALMDIDPERLRVAEIVAHRVAAAVGARPTITATTDRRAALDGAAYAVNMIQVGGYRPSTVIDFEIPKKYGLRQTIADTLGIGGIFRALRTIPVVLDFCRDMAAVCPDVLFLNYVNPMAMVTGAVQRATRINTVGLCHSVQGTAAQLARYLGVPTEAMEYRCAGINHMAFYLDLRANGEDAYPLLRARYGTPHAYPPPPHRDAAAMHDAVRFEMFRRLGYFVTESSEHFAEYVPYFIKRDHPELIEQFHIPLDEYITRCENQNARWAAMRDDLTKRGRRLSVTPTSEYCAQIIHARETNIPAVIYGNVRNAGLITNLPDGCTVEVPCLVDANGIQPTVIGDLPVHLAALMRTNINVQEVTIAAALEGKREHVYHAAMLDPHLAAELTLDAIWSLVDDLFAAHGAMIPAMS